MFGKALGRDNPVDLVAKYPDWETIFRHCSSVSTTFDECCGETTPKLHLKAVREVDDEDDTKLTNELLSSEEKPRAQYAPDELGLLQPVVSQLAATSTGCTDALPN